MSEDVYRSVRMSPVELQAVLAELDARASGVSDEEHPRREHSRMEYRLSDVLVQIQHPGKSSARYLVATRNLSAGGLAFLHGGFLHAGTMCYLVLTDVEGKAVGLKAEVRTCRHVFKSLHEVGVKFLQKVDPKRFCGAAAKVTSNDPELLEIRLPELEGQALLVSADPDERRTLTARLSATGLIVAPAESIGEASDKIKQVPFDVVVLDCELEKEGGVAAVKGVRHAGYQGPLVCIAKGGEGAELTATGEVAAVLNEPAQAETLIGAVAALMQELGENASPKPVYSLLAHSRTMRESIATFVEEAHRAASELCEAFEGEQWDRVRAICESMRRGGSQSGFAVVGEAARRVIALLDGQDQGARGEAVASVHFLSKLCERLRAGREAEGDHHAERGRRAVDRAA